MPSSSNASIQCFGGVFLNTMELEHAFLSCPFEALHQGSRNIHKIVEHELMGLCKQSKAVGKLPINNTSLPNALRQIAQKLRSIHSKMTDLASKENRFAIRCKNRLQHIQELESLSDNDRHNVLLNRLLVDYLLRQGHSNTARMLAVQEGIEDLCEFEVYAQADRIAQSLSKQHDVTKALQWCALNRSRLRKSNISLEFELRIQQVIELTKTGSALEAIKHARQYVGSEFCERPDRVQEIMTAIAFFGIQNSSSKYTELFSDSRWNILAEEFRKAFLRVNGLPRVPLLDLHLQAGLSALKTPFCGTPDQSMSNCPACCADLVELAAKLAPARRSISSLVCRISGCVMDEHNLPLKLPNGHVYSEAALQKQAAKDGGQVTCVQTREKFLLKHCRPVYFS